MKSLPKFSEFYGVDAIHDYTDDYRSANCLYTYRRMISWDDCPHLQTEDKLIERKAILRKYGKNSAFAKSMLFGEFQRGEDYSLIYTDEEIEFMRRAMRGEFTPVGDDIAAGSDTSDGGDRQPMMVRIGTDIVFQDKPAVGMDGDDHAQYLAQRLSYLQINPWDFTIDGGGVGAIIANLMEKQHGYRGIKKAQGNTGPTYKFEYRDKYTEIHFLIKELLAAKVLRLKWNEDLLKQMRTRRFIEMESGLKIKTEPKPAHRKREKCSPDDLDTLVYTFYDFDWTMLGTWKPTESDNSEPVQDDSPTKLEREAAKNSVKGVTFGGLKDMRPIRKRIEQDMRVHKLRIGR